MPFFKPSKGCLPQILVIDFSYNHFLCNLIPRSSKLNLSVSYANVILLCFNFKTRIYSEEIGVRRLFVLVINISKIAKLYQNLYSFLP